MTLGCDAGVFPGVRSGTEAMLLFAIAFVLSMTVSVPVSAQETAQIAGHQISVVTETAPTDGGKDSASALTAATDLSSDAKRSVGPHRRLIVVGFVGGRVRANDGTHREVQLSRSLREDHGSLLDSFIFSNRDGNRALRTILKTLDRDQDGILSEREKLGARIVLYGHSWGASQAITLARRLNQLEIPVLLTIQVDSVRKPRQNDHNIPANVQDAVNFYQNEGLLRGRSRIISANPEKTNVLGNFQMSYRNRRVSCAGYPWYAQLFMHRHIQIENDPVVWARVEAMIVERIGQP